MISGALGAATLEAPVPDDTAELVGVGRGVRAADAAIRLYQRFTAGRPSPCRYWPTCSNYAREAIEVHGLWRGAGLTARRLGRCRPLGSSGFDPVPGPNDDARKRSPRP